MTTYYVTWPSGQVANYNGSDVVWGDPNAVVGDADELLAPLLASHEYNEIESDVMAAFATVFQMTLADPITRINQYGTPQRADFETLERFVKANGLVMDRRSDRFPFMQEIFRGWLSRNPRRGLMFLRWYLRLLYPGTATVDQLWQNPLLPYPDGASPIERPGSWLTSRVRVQLDAQVGSTAAELAQLRSIFLSILPARMVLEMFVSLGQPINATFSMGASMTAFEFRSIEGVGAP